MTCPNRYHLDREDAVDSCVLDDMVLLYHQRSGQTHMVISPVPEIMDVLSGAAPMTAEQVYERLSRAYDLGAPKEAIAAIGHHLENLTALGLVRAG